MIVCAGGVEHIKRARPIGVGLIEAASNLTAICLGERKPEFLLFVGTAGSYGRLKIFDIVRSRVATQIEHCFLQGDCYTPLDNMIASVEDVSRETIVNSSNYITTDRTIAQAYLDRGIDLENMEFYALMRVAQKFGIPAGGVFVVTNFCDENAHEAFKQNHDEAIKRLEEALESSKEH